MHLQVPISTLSFACKMVPPGQDFPQIFLQRMIELARRIAQSHHYI